jgi:hypothetical protein
MITIVFLVLCVVEFGLVYWKYSEIQEYAEIGQKVASVTGVDNNKHYSKFIKIAAKVFGLAKYLLFIAVPVLLFANWIAALILGSILNFFF